MKRLFAHLFVGALLAVCSLDAQAEYDYFNNIRYPGERRQDVGADKIQQETGGDYNLRTVEWWPKQGIDVVAKPAEAIERVWTIRNDADEPLISSPAYRNWWPESFLGKKQFKATLLGFRGLGNKLMLLEDSLVFNEMWGDYWTPAVVLRLEDGRKRCFTRGSFSDKDQQLLMDLYEQEMARIKKTLWPVEPEFQPQTLAKWDIDGKAYTVGTFLTYDKHMVAAAGSEAPDDGVAGVWLNDENKEKAARYRKATMNVYEDWWAYNEYAGHLMPYWEKSKQYKYCVVVGGTKVNGMEILGRGNGGGYGNCSTGNGSWLGLFHEWGHGSTCGGMIMLGGGETLCDAHQTMGDPNVTGKMIQQVVRPWKNLYWGQYPGGLGYAMMADDPNWGYAAVATLATLLTDGEHTPMHGMARLGEERGIYQDGIKEMGDFLGQIGARMAEFDCELEFPLRKAYLTPNRSYLLPIDKKEGLYRSNPIEAPEPFGVNLVRLLPEAGAKEISVDFKGHFDQETYSDWRVCIVGVDKNGTTRYSPLFNKGKMTMETKPGDKRFWLTVTATPTALTPCEMPRGEFDVWGVYQGSFAYRYPYDVKLSGCTPGSPRNTLADSENWDLSGGDPREHDNSLRMDFPVPQDQPGYDKMVQRLNALKPGLPALEERVINGDLYVQPWWKHNTAGKAIMLSWRIEYLLANAKGHRHANGGGWVAESASVDPTAYVGEHCMVLDGAKVLGGASIEGYAVLSGPEVVVKDNAKVYGKAMIYGAAEISGYARVRRSINNRVVKVTWNEDDPNAPPYVFSAESGPVAKRDSVEMRVNTFKGYGYQLQANYDFHRPESVLMEDNFIEHSTGGFGYGAHSEDLVFYDGVLVGSPGFTEEGGVSAITFNGKNQYAEAAVDVADLGEITLVTSIQPAGKAGTIFDFGSSKENRMVLTLSQKGVVELEVTKHGKSQKIAGGKLAANAWETLRVEADGERIALWVGDKKVAEAKSNFRPADAYPGGEAKRNFVATDRDQKNLFAGAMDYLRVYHAVFDDFSTAREIPLVSSRRIYKGFVEKFNKRFANFEKEEAAFMANVKAHPTYRFYEDWGKTVDSEIARLESSPEADAADSKFAKMQQTFNAKKREVEQEYSQQPEAKENQEKFRAAEREYQSLWQEMRKANPEYAKIDKQRKENEPERNELWRNVEAELKAEGVFDELEVEQKAKEQVRNDYIEANSKKDPAVVEANAKLIAAEKALKKAEEDKAQNELASLRDKVHLARRERDHQVNLWRDHDPKARELGQAHGKVGARKHEMIQARARSLDRYKEIEAAKKRADQKRGKLDEAIRSNSNLKELETKRESFNTRDAKNSYVAMQMKEKDKELKAVEKLAKDLRIENALDQNADEYHALTVLGYGMRQYARCTENCLKVQMMPLMPEDREQMRFSMPYQTGKWHTEVDWDPEQQWEKQGELSPLMLRWYKQVKPYQYK